MLSYGDGAGYTGSCSAISSDFQDGGSELIDHCDDVSPPPLSPLLSSQPSALLSYGDGAGHDGPCAAKSSNFRDDRSELIDPCDDVSLPALLGASCDERCVTVAMDFGDGGSGLIDHCEDVSTPPPQPPSMMLPVSLSCGGLNDLCNDVTKRGDGGPGFIDDTLTAEPLSLSSSTVEPSYCGLNDLCGDMAEHENDVITRSTPCGGVSL